MKIHDNESRLSRWSRRKQQTRAETKQEDLDVDLLVQTQLPESAAEPTASEENDTFQSAQGQPAPDQPALTDADMPAIDTLNSESDFSMFMSSGVTDTLRNLALKQLFKAPLFNLRDGLDEYDEDYTFFEKLGDTVTCDMKHQIEMEALKKEAAKAKAQEDRNEEDALNEVEVEEDDLVEEELLEDKSEGKLEDNSPDTVQKESDIETKQIELPPEDLDPIPTKPETIEGSVTTKGESS